MRHPTYPFVHTAHCPHCDASPVLGWFVSAFWLLDEESPWDLYECRWCDAVATRLDMEGRA